METVGVRQSGIPKLFLFSIALCLPTPVVAQTNPHDLLKEADGLELLYSAPKAATLYTEAESLFAAAGDAKDALAAHLGKIRATAESISVADASREMTTDLQTSLVQSDPSLLLRCLIAKATVDEEVNEAFAEDSWEKVAELAKRLDAPAWRIRAQGELGTIAFLDGDVAKSTDMLKSALLSAYLSHDVGAMVIFGAMVGNGLVEIGQADSGLKYCDLAISTANSTKDMGFPFIAYMGKARALLALNRDAQAKEVLNQALTQAKLQTARWHEVQLLIVLGKQAETSEESREAIQHLRTAADISKASGFLHTLAWSEFELAQVYRDTGDLDKAATTMLQSVDLMRQLEDRYHLPQHLALLAELRTKQGDFAEAASLYEEAADDVQGLLINAPSPQVESSLLATMSQVYRGEFSLAATSLKDVTRAYLAVERARGRSIASILTTPHLKAEDRRKISPAAAREIDRLQIDLLHTTSHAQRRQILDRLFEVEQLLLVTHKPQSAFRTAVLRSEPVDLRHLQSALRSDEVVLEYVLDQPRSFCLSITATHVAVATLPGGSQQIERLAGKYLAEVRARRDARETGSQLGSILVGPLGAFATHRRWIIVPDGALHLVPFDSLRDSRGRLLVKSHVISYAPSATVLHLLRTSLPHPRAPLAFLGVGAVPYEHEPATATKTGTTPASGAVGVFGTTPPRLINLPGSGYEVKSVSHIIGGKGVMLFGQQATEAAFKAQPLGDFQIIHLAVHGVSSADFPDRAGLILAYDPASHEDSLLQVREIRDLTLHADLVVLSACDAAEGRLQGEEGIANVVRAFLIAGAKAVVASLWNADDASTTNLMEGFYEHLARGEDEGTALRDAKLDLLRQYGNQAVPFYWAGFTVTGDGAASLRLENRSTVPTTSTNQRNVSGK